MNFYVQSMGFSFLDLGSWLFGFWHLLMLCAFFFWSSFLMIILLLINLLLSIKLLLLSLLLIILWFHLIFINLTLLHLYAVIVPLALILTIHTSSVSSHITHVCHTLLTKVHLCNLFFVFLVTSEVFVQTFLVQDCLFVEKSFGKSVIFFFNSIIFTFSDTHVQACWAFAATGGV